MAQLTMPQPTTEFPIYTQSTDQIEFYTSDSKSNQVIEIPSQHLPDITQILLVDPYSPVALSVSVCLVIGSVGGVIKIIKSTPEEWEALGKSISMVIGAIAKLIKTLKSK
ncbi:MAG: hypothetical protein ACKO3K_12200 [Cuspidothrix sp.]